MMAHPSCRVASVAIRRNHARLSSCSTRRICSTHPICTALPSRHYTTHHVTTRPVATRHATTTRHYTSRRYTSRHYYTSLLHVTPLLHVTTTRHYASRHYYTSLLLYTYYTPVLRNTTLHYTSLLHVPALHVIQHLVRLLLHSILHAIPVVHTLRHSLTYYLGYLPRPPRRCLCSTSSERGRQFAAQTGVLHVFPSKEPDPMASKSCTASIVSPTSWIYRNALWLLAGPSLLLSLIITQQ